MIELLYDWLLCFIWFIVGVFYATTKPFIEGYNWKPKKVKYVRPSNK